MTREEQDANLKLKASKKKPHKVKASFSEWLLHDKLAFKVVYIMGAISGILVMLALVAISFIFDFHITFKILFGLLAIWQGWVGIGVLRKHKYIGSTINEIAYKGKYSSPYYKKEATPQ